MRFCFITSRDWLHPAAAGGDFYLSNLARGLAKRGHSVVYLTSSFDDASSRQCIDGVEVRRIRPGPLYPVRLFREFIRVKDSVDVVLEEIFGGKRTFTMARIYSRKPLVAVWYQRHDRIFAEQYPGVIAKTLSLTEKLLARIYRGSPVMTLSRKSASELSEMGIDPRKIGIVPSAALIEFPGTEELLPFEKRRDTLVFIGKIRKYKRIDHTIQALKAVTEGQKGCRLIIAGNVAKNDGECLAKLKEEAHHLGLERLVDFRIYPGAIPPNEKVELLKQCKVLLQPSPVEGFSMTTVEANACGTPVVVSDGVPADAVIDGENGLVYRFGDIETMAHHCRLLLEDSVLWEKLSSRAVSMAQRFNWEASTDAFENFINKI